MRIHRITPADFDNQFAACPCGVRPLRARCPSR
jgi:hypothetical protein